MNVRNPFECLAVLMFVCSLCGCGVSTTGPTAGPTFQQMSADMCQRLRAIQRTNDLGAWAAECIQRHSAAASSRPALLPLGEIPSWIFGIYDASERPRAFIHYGSNPANHRVTFNWASGRGIWTIVVAGASYAPALDYPTAHVTACEPGLFVLYIPPVP